MQNSRNNQIFTIKEYFLQKYSQPVYKISLDAGFTCPVRDGTRGTGGCIYCDENGSGTGARKRGLSLKAQMEQGMEFYRQKRKARKFLAYFQAFSNTYGPVKKLKQLYDEALSFENVLGLSVGTRPDCVDEKVVKLLASYLGKYEVWLELGLQSAHDETLKKINRGHNVADFQKALKLAHQWGLPVCVHVILGLPGETEEMMMATARYLKENKIEGIKIHPLMIKKNTPLEKLYLAGQIRPLTLEEYADLAAGFLVELGPEVVAERLTGEDYSGCLLAPDFCNRKSVVLNRIKIRYGEKIARNEKMAFGFQKC
jgi:radical SAM protein (TIGR01212 family)